MSAASERAASKIYSDALSEDPTAFDYDNVYDSFKAVQSKAQPLSRTKAPVNRCVTPKKTHIVSCVKLVKCFVLQRNQDTSAT